MSLDKKSQSFKVLIDNAPVASLIEIINYIQVFYKFEKDADINKEPILEYHQKYYSLVQDNHKYYFITKDNQLQHVEGFQYEFYEVEYDFEKKTKTPVILTVDISTQRVLKKEKIDEQQLSDIYKSLNTQHIDSFELYLHLQNRFAQENFIKHFFIKEKNGVLVFFYTIKNYKKKNFEQFKKKIRIELFYGFLQSDTGQKFSHKKIFREIKTLKDTQMFLSHLQEIENIYIDILIQAIVSQNSILHNIRLEKPIIQSSFSWDIFGNYKIKLMDEIHKEGLNVDHKDSS